MHKRCPRKNCNHTTTNADEMLCPKCREKLVIQLERGDCLGDYVVRQAMHSGVGGMGTVYRARHTAQRRNVAIKIAHGKPYQYDALELEAECLARLEHPGIVRIQPLGRDAAQRQMYVHKTYLMGEPLNYIVLEWVQGKSLKTLLAEQGPPPPAEAARIVAGVAEALGYAHAQGVAHLDVKPANIMIDATTGRPVLMDFGISRRLDQPERLIPEKNLGTAGYMSPEHVRNEPVDARADIFSLGVVFYELLTGSGPFWDGSTRERLRMTLEMDAPRPSSVNRALGRRWDRVVARALHKDAQHRYRDMQAFRKAVAKPSWWPPSIAVVASVGAMSVLTVFTAIYLSMSNGWPPFTELENQGTQVPTTIVITPTITDVVSTPEPTASVDTDATGTPEPTTPSLPIEVSATEPAMQTPDAIVTRAPTSTLAPTPTPTPTPIPRDEPETSP